MSTTARRAPVGLVILAASVPAFMASLDNLVVTNALPVLATDLEATLEQLQWFVNGYSLAFASMILMAVALGDRYGRRRVFSGGIALFTFASILCALAPTAEALIAARVLQGIGGAALMPLSLAILASNVSERMRPMAIGIWGGVAGLGVAVGPLVGGAVVEGMSWHAMFWLNVPVGILALMLIRAYLTESRGARAPLDIVGLGLGMAGVFGVVFGIIRGNEAGWTSGQVLAGLVGGSVLLAGFVAWERRRDDALLPMRLFRDRSFSVANVVGVMFSIGILGAVFILIQFLQVVQGKSPLEAGVMTMPWTMAPLVVAPLTGLIAPRVGTRALVTAGVSSQAVGLAWIGLVLDPSVAYGALVPGFVLCGVGMGLVFAPLATAVLAHMSEADQAKASGTNATLREIGVALGIAILTAVFTGAGGELTPTGYTDAAQTAVLVGAAILAVTVMVATLLPRRSDQPTVAARDDAAGAPAEAPALIPA
ncbi:DHA2 family efflux MFS transporter permease subunit [Demequina sp. SYSU T00039]|uniref:DHA2 family efflux MFS transporter permease subunit n=1 Tax=Demequina lignilytica TaxID=3051663 RepID=A0AAW7M7S8_9MICO|nr:MULTISPECIES: DHA2 family efflux MFS transporter permease subunit [unclassified Demequina]MDN4477954.1 DHA2 family efflux MFS transporter permease subunit [Demequina sp. SYSU T00039-1]MDN4487863.1 DHA2 family efflux MFS transporter permease subunit [Demequina sp. SYSU T00039]MDN4490754.1 DHA2 family efflux MFS transporter permease subunit [Demequina sp. SYSU T00068]